MHKFLIKTEYLGLRFIRKEDITYLQGLDKDPEVKEFFPEGTLSNTEIKEFINYSLSSCKKKNLPCFVIFNLISNDFVGEAYFDELESGEIKVGYLFHKKYWNKGYATEVLTALFAWAKAHIDTDYIIGYADKDNAASFHVMENCGMEYYKDGHFLGMDCMFYRIKLTPDDY